MKNETPNKQYRLLLLAACLILPLAVKAGDNVELKPGASRSLSFSSNIGTVFVAKPDVADYKVIDDKNIVLYARKAGNTDLVVYGNDSKVISSMHIDVDEIAGDLDARVVQAYPDSHVSVRRFMNGDKVAYILTGTATDDDTRDGIYQLVGSLVGTTPSERNVTWSDESSGLKNNGVGFMQKKVYDNVINRIELPSPNQVNVKLTLVEVSKVFTDNLGIDWSSLTLDTMLGQKPGANDAGSFSLLGFKGLDASNISTTINAIHDDSVGEVLAEPNLTVLSGETASFLVGGQIPIIVQSKDSTSVEYKEYGIKLNVGAKVENRKKIKLFIADEMSDVDGAYAYNKYNIPTLKTRRSSSTIELADGESFAIGGLLTDSDTEKLAKVPFIGDIPILGAIARHAQTERKKSELVVFATVHMVKPTTSHVIAPLALPKYRRTNVEKLFFNAGSGSELREGELSQSAGSFLDAGGFAK